MNTRSLTLIIGAAMLAVLGAACVTSRSEGPPKRGEPQIVEPGEPAGSTSPPITIIDTIDPDVCSFIHNINACFSEGQPPVDIPLGDYMDLYFKAKQDLGERTGEDHLGAKIKSVEKVEWNDSSLGNPEPGAFYLQVITPGFKMVLESGGQFHTYHTSLDRVVFVGSS